MKKVLPLALKIVASLFIFNGVIALIEMFFFNTNNGMRINFGVFGIFIGLGLFKLSRGWRICALVTTWVLLMALPLIGFLFLDHPGPLDFSIFGQKSGYVSKEIGVTMVFLFWVYNLWQYRVLTRKEVLKLFEEKAEEQGEAKHI